MHSDEVPLHRIKVDVRTDVEWNTNVKGESVGGS